MAKTKRAKMLKRLNKSKNRAGSLGEGSYRNCNETMTARKICNLKNKQSMKAKDQMKKNKKGHRVEVFRQTQKRQNQMAKQVAVQTNNALDTEEPTTTRANADQSVVFQKFRDDLLHKQKTRVTSTQNVSYTKRLMASIRRKIQNKNNLAAKARRLSFTKNKQSKETSVIEATLDDDCILVESNIEQIIIDDDDDDDDDDEDVTLTECLEPREEAAPKQATNLNNLNALPANQLNLCAQAGQAQAGFTYPWRMGAPPPLTATSTPYATTNVNALNWRFTYDLNLREQAVHRLITQSSVLRVPEALFPYTGTGLLTSAPLLKAAETVVNNVGTSNGGNMFNKPVIDLTPKLMPKPKGKKRKKQNRQNKTPSDLEEVIEITDTTIQPPLETAQPAAAATTPNADVAHVSEDDSVIFVSETRINKVLEFPDYIPLVSNDVPNPIKMPDTKVKTKPTPSDLFSSSERKQLAVYNNNAYNPNSERPLSKKRTIVIDASNIAFAHSNNREFSVKGLMICIKYFEKSGHQIKAVVPQYRLRFTKSSDPNQLEKLKLQGKLVITPSKNLPGLQSSSYDDRFILQLACELDAVIVSNDNYRDLINENSAFKKIIENRVIGYSWCDDIFILPKDPYGKRGPTLEQILNR